MFRVKVMALFSSSTSSIPDADTVPRHVAIIMDGNGRWAKRRFLPRVAGHHRGVEALRETIKTCIARQIAYLTVFAFSSENWRRPADEVSVLRQLFVAVLETEVDRMMTNGIQLRIIGNIDQFGDQIAELARRAEQLTAANSKMTLTIAANYGGRWDLMQAMNRVAQEHAGQSVEFTEELLAPHLAMSYAPEPDLFVRTGGEQRISNFLLWQLAYTELYFTPTLWPDFNAAALDEAIAWYSARERRFGRTSEQLDSGQEGGKPSSGRKSA